MAETSRFRKVFKTSWMSGSNGYKPSTRVLGDYQEFLTHLDLEKHYKAFHFGHKLKKAILKIANKVIRAVDKRDDIGISVDEEFMEFKKGLTRPASVRSVDAYCWMLRQAAEINRKCSEELKNVVNSLSRPLDELRFRNALLPAEKYSKTRKKMQHQYAEYQRLLKDSHKPHPRKDTEDRLVAIEAKLATSRELLRVGVATLESLKGADRDQEAIILENLIQLVKAEADYHDELSTLLHNLEQELRVIREVWFD